MIDELDLRNLSYREHSEVFKKMFVVFVCAILSFIIGDNAYQVHWGQPYHLLILKNDELQGFWQEAAVTYRKVLFHNFRGRTILYQVSQALNCYPLGRDNDYKYSTLRLEMGTCVKRKRVWKWRMYRHCISVRPLQAGYSSVDSFVKH
jgi:hypothetical protein